MEQIWVLGRNPEIGVEDRCKCCGPKNCKEPRLEAAAGVWARGCGCRGAAGFERQEGLCRGLGARRLPGVCLGGDRADGDTTDRCGTC